MLLVGDKIKQVKEIGGFNYIGTVFNIDSVEGTNVTFSNYPLGKGVMSIGEFQEYFEKVEEPKWSEWRKYQHNIEYRIKDNLIEAREIQGEGSSVFAKTCDEDEFILSVGMDICLKKLEIRKIKRKAREIKKEKNLKIQELNREIAKINKILKEQQ